MSLPEVIRRYVGVVQGSFDIDKYVELFSKDVSFRDAESGRVLRGRSKLAEAVQPFTMLSELSTQLLRHAVDGNTVFAEVEMLAKSPTGDPVRSRGVIIFTLDGSEIAAVEAYLFRQNVSIQDPSR